MSNVIVTGGNSLLPGFNERLLFDLQQRTPPALRLKITQPTNPNLQIVDRLFRYCNNFKTIN